MEIVLPHPLVVMSCLAAFGVGYIIRWALEAYDIDIEEQLRQLLSEEKKIRAGARTQIIGAR